ncbi:MAG: ribonuclease HII [Myxococcota bacterium]|jgi:ribonuclease HII|nr:ribonuclease HII [Myxococcota bacterium]
MSILGLDEAGRGSVLGPLVVGAFYCAAHNLPRLAPAGAADSKTLTRKRRETALTALIELGTAETVSITARQIDQENINTLEENAFIELILRFRPERVYLDAPVAPRGIPALVARIRSRVGDVELVVEPKADGRYPVVGAASIAAKVHRDAAIRDLGAVGSGYPSDPVTRDWIRGFLERGDPLPACVRSRWGTLDRLRQESLFPSSPPNPA